MFYHFTSVEHWIDIQQTGLIYPTESNVGSPLQGLEPSGVRLGPDVVWLLDGPDLGDAGHGLTGSIHDKTAVCIEVDVPAIRWLDWEFTAKMNPAWRSITIKTGGGDDAAARWYVWPAAIPRQRWHRVITTTNDKEHHDG